MKGKLMSSAGDKIVVEKGVRNKHTQIDGLLNGVCLCKAKMVLYRINRKKEVF